MTWEETIKYIRTKPEFRDLVEKTYLDENLVLNVERFQRSDEFSETLKLIEKYSFGGKKLLDIGSGNGISAVAFALNGFTVTAVEPDPSSTVGAGAIRKLRDHFKLDNLSIREGYAENLEFIPEYFDIVYARQCMHHAYNLEKFISELSRILKKGGLLLTLRDHVVFNHRDKHEFLKSHPLNKYYNGENAFTPKEYKNAFSKAGLISLLEIKYFDSIINYYPLSKVDIKKYKICFLSNLKATFKKKVGMLSFIPFVFYFYKLKNGYIGKEVVVFEKGFPGRMYSYVLKKN